MTYKPRAALVPVVSPTWCHIVSDIAVSPKNDACVALNVNNRQLIIYNVDFDNETEMAMDSLLTNIPADDKSLLFGRFLWLDGIGVVEGVEVRVIGV